MNKQSCCGRATVSLAGSDDVVLARLAQALGHPARLAIIRYLLGRDACVCGEIVSRLPLAQSTVSQHLKMLKEAGWICGETDGPRVCYCINPVVTGKFKALMGALLEASHETEGPEEPAQRKPRKTASNPAAKRKRRA